MTHFLRPFAFVILLGVMVPSALLVAPAPAHAIPVEVISDTSPTNLLDLAKNTITSVNSVTQTAATVALQVKNYVLQPLAFVVSGNLLKSITAGIINFIGGANGTGKPLFVQNLPGYLQNVGDVQAYSFLNQFSGSSNSPFAAAITSSLRTNYLQQTSLAGFFAANQNTLSRFSPNINSFLAGNWSAGGAGAWFALTTQDQNNPYMLYYRSQDQLTRTVQSQTAAKLAQLNWGQGFMSWCGTASAAPAGGQSCDLATGSSDCPSDTACTPVNGSTTVGTCISTGKAGSSSPQPGDSCTNSDGTQGQIQTPGSVIKDYLAKALGSNIDKLNQIGDISTSISSILSNIGTVMQTVNLAASLFGGTNGLFGSSVGGTSTYTSPFAQYLNTPGYLGVTTQNVAGNSTATTDLSTRASQYQSSWNTIGGVANTTQSNLNTLVASCPQRAAAAQSALTNEVNPIIAAYAAATSTVATANAQVAKVQSEGATGSPAYPGDLATLTTLPPSASDVTQAQQQATDSGGAIASPTGSLNVVASSFVGQLNLINANARAMILDPSVCPPPATDTSTPPPPAQPPAPSNG